MTKIIEPTKCNTCISAGGGDCATCEPEMNAPSPQPKEYIITQKELIDAQLWRIDRETAVKVRSRPAPSPQEKPHNLDEFIITRSELFCLLPKNPPIALLDEMVSSIISDGTVKQHDTAIISKAKAEERERVLVAVDDAIRASRVCKGCVYYNTGCEGVEISKILCITDRIIESLRKGEQ